MNRHELPRQLRAVPPSTAVTPYPGRTPHWIKPNHTERIPHRWIVADSESRTEQLGDTEVQTLRCVVATRWRDDLETGERQGWHEGTDAAAFWEWVTSWCYTHGRTVCWFHNAGHDLRILDAFTQLPRLGWEMIWCNLDRNVSVVTWRGPGGTLVIADTYTWCPTGLDKLAPLVGVHKPRLPAQTAGTDSWLTRCRADVLITEQVVRRLLAYIRAEHCGNWQPSGAGMGYTTWRHRFMQDKCLVHDDSAALAAEREAMHAGRAEAWWHGKAQRGPFTEWDMSMSYPTICAEMDVPAKLWAYDRRPSKRVTSWARQHWMTLWRVRVQTAVPCVPARANGRIYWPVGEFVTTLWADEADLVTECGGSYQVLDQWRYVPKPALKAWARWSIQQTQLSDQAIDPVARTWVKHQARAVIGRLGLMTPTWREWADNWTGEAGLSYLVDADSGQESRLMHVGSKTFMETGRTESDSSLPQITSYVMAMARVRLWRACQAAGMEHVVHVDTDSLITDAAGDRAMAAAVAAGLPGSWRPKRTWRSLEVTGPRHYRAPDRRVVPGVPLGATEVRPGEFEGEVWESLASALERGGANTVRVRARTWRPSRVDHRRPWRGEQAGPALPLVASAGPDGSNYVDVEQGSAGDRQVVEMPRMPGGRVEAGGGRGPGRGAHSGNRPPDQLGPAGMVRRGAAGHGGGSQPAPGGPQLAREQRHKDRAPAAGGGR